MLYLWLTLHRKLSISQVEADRPNLRRIIDLHGVDEFVDGVELVLRRSDDVVEERREAEVTNVLHERHLDVGLMRKSMIISI